MRAAWREAERIAEVRGAAKDWKRSGAIDAAALAAIETDHPSPRLELAKAWDVLIFILVSVAIGGVQFAVIGFESASGSGQFFLFAALLAAATEALRGSRLAGTGSDAATSFWMVVNFVVGTGILLDAGPHQWAATATIAAAAAGFGAACWRWGFPVYGAFAAAAGFGFFARFPAGRLLWALAGAAGCVVFARLSVRARFSPSRRAAFAGAFVASALALYGAANIYSWNEQLIENLQGGYARGIPPFTGPWQIFLAATVLVPAAFVVWGVRARRRLVLDTGALLAALSILTWHHYARFGSIAITAFGLALVGLALWLNRRLRAAAGPEERGFTVSPLYSPESEALAPVAALAAAGVAPASPPRSDQDFTPGGGGYGGGGATGTY